MNGIIDTIGSKWHIVLTNYSKRILKKPYSKLFETKIGQKIKGMSGSQKLSLEGALYVISMFIDDKLPRGSKLKESAMEIIRDMFPEIGERIVNSDSELADAITEDIASNLKKELNPMVEEERLLGDLLDKFSDRAVVSIASLVVEAPKSQRSEILKRLLAMSKEQAGDFSRFSEKDQRVILSAMGFEDKQNKWLSNFNNEVGETLGWMTGLLNNLSGKMRDERRKGK